MTFQIAIILILLCIIFYVAIVNIFAIMFRLTGLQKDKCVFQVLSLFTNCGFTTGESEIIVNNKLRRKIATACMVVGHVFSVLIVSIIVLLIQSFNKEQAEDSLTVSLIAFGVFAFIIIVFQLPFVKKPTEKLVEKISAKILKTGNGDNFITVLDTFGNDAVAEIFINNLPELFKNKTLFESNVKPIYDINVMSLKRKGKAIKVTKDTVIQNEDTILVYGDYNRIKDLFRGTRKEIEVINSEKMNKRNAIFVIENYGEDAMVEIMIYNLPDFLINSKLKDGVLGSKIKVLLIKKGGLVFQAKGDTIIEEGDTITVYGDYKIIKDVFVKQINVSKK